MIVVFMFGEMGAANRISVFYAIFHPNDRTVQLMMSTVDDAIGAAIYGWAYVLCPPIASLPVISYYCDSRTSGYCDFLETRDGRRKYVARLFFSIFISAFLVTMLSYVFYVIVCLIRFPLNPVAPDGFIIQFIGYEEQTVFDVIKDSFARFLLFAVYAGAVSALGNGIDREGAAEIRQLLIDEKDKGKTILIRVVRPLLVLWNRFRIDLRK